MSGNKNNPENHCRINGSDFRLFKSGELRGVVSASTDDNLLDKLADPDSLLTESDLSKNTSGTTAGGVNINGQKYFLKRYNNHKTSHYIKNSLRRPRPFKALNAMLQMEKLGILAPRPLAAFYRQRGMVNICSYLLSEFQTDISTVAQNAPELGRAENMPAFVDAVCWMFKTIHEAGISHGDPKMSNMLLYHGNKGYGIGLIDFDDTEIHGSPLSKPKRIRELARAVSSWASTCRSRQITCPVLSELKNIFSIKYYEMTGIDIAGTRYSQRVDYLFNRIRKK